jgi:hypothetical protein
MEKLLQDAKKQLAEIEAQGISMNNLEPISKLVAIVKDLGKVEKMEREKKEMEYGNYRVRDGYGADYRDGGYRDGEYRANYRDGYGGEYRDIYVDMYRDESRGDYGRRGVPGSGRRYRGSERMQNHMDRIMDGAEMYEAGRDRYRHGGDEHRMKEGLEKLMYALCVFIESTMEFAESPEEKEIIRKHVEKLKKL